MSKPNKYSNVNISEVIKRYMQMWHRNMLKARLNKKKILLTFYETEEFH